MSEVISYGRREYAHKFELCWQWRDDPNAGFGFECNEAGEVNEAELHEYGKANLKFCRENPEKVTGPEIVRYEWSWWNATKVKCDCGRVVDCTDVLTNECDCGALYNSGGQRLAPYEQWEAEDLQDAFGGGFDGDEIE